MIYEGNDKDALNRLFGAIDVKHVPKAVVRLGKQQEGPLKVIMKNVKEKMDVMKALPKLKHKNQKISVKEDYTQEERKKIRRYVSIANSRNMNEPGGQVWCVKGSPRTKLRIVKKDQNDQSNHPPTKHDIKSASQRPTQA